MKTAVCIASGPSLTKEDVEYLKDKDCRIYAVKEAILFAPFAHEMYAADGDWWEICKDLWTQFEGEKWTCNLRTAEKYNLYHVGVKHDWNWSYNPEILASGGNSGFQVMNKAELDGADRIILMGYNYGHSKNQDKHFFDETHPRFSRLSKYGEWLSRMKKAQQYMTAEFLNATPNSAIDIFPHVNIRDVL